MAHTISNEARYHIITSTGEVWGDHESEADAVEEILWNGWLDVTVYAVTWNDKANRQDRRPVYSRL